jgi:hypothetical protein
MNPRRLHRPKVGALIFLMRNRAQRPTRNLCKELFAGSPADWLMKSIEAREPVELESRPRGCDPEGRTWDSLAEWPEPVLRKGFDVG